MKKADRLKKRTQATVLRAVNALLRQGLTQGEAVGFIATELGYHLSSVYGWVNGTAGCTSHPKLARLATRLERESPPVEDEPEPVILGEPVTEPPESDYAGAAADTLVEFVNGASQHGVLETDWGRRMMKLLAELAR